MMLTTREAAEELGISASRILKLITAGRLRAEKRGRDWWIERRDLDAVRDRKAGRPPPAKPRRRKAT